MSTYDRIPDPDDMFSDTRMTFGEHIEDLRVHLIRAILGFLVAMIASFFLAPQVLHFIDKPVREQLSEYWRRFNEKRQKELEQEVKTGTEDLKLRPITTTIAFPRREFREHMLREFPGLKKLAVAEDTLDLMPAIEDILRRLDVDELVDWKQFRGGGNYVEFKKARLLDPMSVAFEMQKYNQVFRPPALTTLSVQEAFMVYFKVAIMTGFVLGSPWIFYQVWMFIAAGLYPNEKKYVNIFLPFSLFLFLAGVFLCEWFVMTKAVEALLWFNEWLGFSPDLRLNEWLGFAIFMPLVFGLSFQTPLVMLFVQRVGLFHVDSFRNKRRIAWFTLAVFAAVITPSTDPFSMMMLWLPMSLLYELGIFLCVHLPGRPLLDFDVPENEDQVEV
jgi:sec-independent protein translocase protein TatC